MARNGIQFQKGFSLHEFQKLYGTEQQARPLWRTLAGLTAFAVHAAMVRSMVWSMAGGSVVSRG
jgi:hypothetical protein